MDLHWADYFEIAEKLYAAYPHEDLSTISYAELTKMASSLPDFADGLLAPDEYTLDAILACWTELQFPEDPENVPASDI